MSGITSWHSYPKIYGLGHSAIEKLLEDPVLVEEKIDGSQFSFGYFPGEDPELKIRSKGVQMLIEAPEKMFEPAAETVRVLKPLLKPGWTYRAEFLARPKHNTLNYSRVPCLYLMLFDISPSEEKYLSYDEKKEEADRLGLELVPKIFEGRLTFDSFKAMLDLQSCLGNTTLEGVVIKNYSKFGVDKKVLMGKYVSEAFKERNKSNWNEVVKIGGSQLLTVLAKEYRTQARWEKAYQFLRDSGKTTDRLQDIPTIMARVRQDIEEECIVDIKEKLWQWAKKQIMGSSTAGLPEWYKNKLAEKQFNGIQKA